MIRPLLALCLLLVFACSSTAPPHELQEVHTAINQTGQRLHLLSIEQEIPAGKSFRPSVYADVGHAIPVEELNSLDRKELATNSMGMALTLYNPQHKKPVHAYLVAYPVYKHHSAPKKLRINVSAAQLKQARQGKTVQVHGSYRVLNRTYLSWVMWLSNKSLDVDCGCS